MTQNLLVNVGEMLKGLWESSGLANGTWQNYVMLLISFILFYLAIVKKFEPLLLLAYRFRYVPDQYTGARMTFFGENITPATRIRMITSSRNREAFCGISSTESKRLFIRRSFSSESGQ